MTRIEPSSHLRAGHQLIGLLIDAALVLIFTIAGRSSHGEAVVSGLLTTAWPFLLGLLVGWSVTLAVGRGRLDAWRIRPAGLLAWAGTVGVGMVARVLAGQGTAPTFIVVAGVVLALFLLGWRFAARRLALRRTR